MLAENVLVSTLDAGTVFARANEVLEGLRFVPAGATPATESSWEWIRGRKKVKYYVRISDLPQQFRLEFDRGRVVLTAVVEERGREKPKLHEAMLLSVLSAVTLRIEGRDLSEALGATVVAQSDIDRVYRRQRAFMWVMVAFLVLVFGLIGTAIVAAMLST